MKPVISLLKDFKRTPNTVKHSRVQKNRLVGSLAGLFSLISGSVFMGAAIAEVLPVNTLGRVGATDLQTSVGNGVQAVCGQFIAANNANTPPANELEADLFDKCGEMVHTARTVTGEAGATGKSLELSEAELQGALQNIAAEEYEARGSMATEASAGQAANIGKRLSTLMSKSSGLQLSAVNLFGKDALYMPSGQEIAGLSGGSAGEGDLLANRLGVFINGDFGSGEKDATDGEDGFSHDSTGFTVGVDYIINDGAILGLAAGFSSSSSDFDVSSTVSGGGLDTENTNISTYALFFKGDWFYDGILTVGQGDFDMERRVVMASNSDVAENDGADRTAKGNADSSLISFSFGGGTEIRKGNKTFAPYARLNFLDVELDAFEETGAEGLNFKIDKQDITSLTSAVGFRMTSVKNTSFGVLVPQAHIEWVHEFEDDKRELSTIYVNDPRQNEIIIETDEPDRDYFSVGLGASAVLKGGTQAFVDVKSILGLTDFSEIGVTIGVRFAL